MERDLSNIKNIPQNLYSITIIIIYFSLHLEVYS